MFSNRRRPRTARSASRVVCLLVVSACGASEPAEVMVSDPHTREVSGVVVDGYLEGATVFVDLNANHELDSDEPQTTTDAKGNFKLTVHGLDAETFAAVYVHASVPDSAKDADDHGATLREAGKAGFTLLSPASGFSLGDAGTAAPIVMSPLSTLVAGEMIKTGRDLAEAKATVQARLGLTGKDLLQDFVASSDEVLHNVARASAVSLGEAERSASASADGGTQRESGEHFLAALASVQDRLPNLVDALGLRESKQPASLDDIKREWANDEAGERSPDGGSSVRGEVADAGRQAPATGELDRDLKQPEPTRDAEIVKQPEPARDAEIVKQPEPARDAAVIKLPEPVRDAAVTKQPEPARDAAVIKLPEPVHDAAVVKPREPVRDAG
jgi:hypothetical protein